MLTTSYIRVATMYCHYGLGKVLVATSLAPGLYFYKNSELTTALL